MDTNKQILQSIKEIREELRQTAKKDDLKQFATKDDLKQFPTKDDLKRFATKDDLIALEKRFDRKFATKEDLMQFATKSDLKSMKNEIIEEMSDLITGFVQTIDEHKADRKDLHQLEKRVDRLETQAA